MNNLVEKHLDENGNLHREDGPALIYEDGSQYWYYYGELHRIDGPAVIYEDGTQYWCNHGKRITKQVKQWYKERNLDINNLSDEDTIALKIEVMVKSF